MKGDKHKHLFQEHGCKLQISTSQALSCSSCKNSGGRWLERCGVNILYGTCEPFWFQLRESTGKKENFCLVAWGLVLQWCSHAVNTWPWIEDSAGQTGRLGLYALCSAMVTTASCTKRLGQDLLMLKNSHSFLFLNSCKENSVFLAWLFRGLRQMGP